ncbi:MAG: hypothetical protein ACM33T_17700 [Solirubrobacterales bacterium]
MTTHITSDGRALCRLAFDLNSAALALAAEAAEIACRGLPPRGADIRLYDLAGTLADLLGEIEQGTSALRIARIEAACPLPGFQPFNLPAE